MELSVGSPAIGTIEIAGATVHTASATAPTSPGDLFLSFGLETNGTLTAPMSVGFDNIVVTLK
jgi:hypothetical protein